MAAEFTPEELAMYILSLTVQDPDSLPEVEIAREKPLPFKPSGGGFGGKGKGGRGNGHRGDQRRDRNRRDDREGGRRDFKRKSNKNSRDLRAKVINVLIALPMKRKMALSSATKGINKS